LPFNLLICGSDLTKPRFVREIPGISKNGHSHFTATSVCGRHGQSPTSHIARRLQMTVIMDQRVILQC